MSAIVYNARHTGPGGGTAASVSYMSYPYHWMPVVVPAGSTWDGAAPKPKRPASSPHFRAPSPTTHPKRPSTSLSKPSSSKSLAKGLQRPQTTNESSHSRLGTASSLASNQPSQDSLRSRSSLALSAVGNVHSKVQDNVDGAFSRTFGKQPRVGRSFSRTRSLKGVKGFTHPALAKSPPRPSTSLSLTRERSKKKLRSRSTSPVSLTIFEYSAASRGDPPP
eukprot:CAMPEP_0114156054 /NCGR_PEP_ID=MMETSP0043_2-20121206/25827_1 /TAXON_ID=464988 /ORGANISM="Hemiselmis andersenii, Strain CCMP644" /LENGTH=220 /DNA_ID=CAMNT_0001251417 /DNA_START=470 /DNA_END=1128 /DNA_ORIENTATION=+